VLKREKRFLFLRRNVKKHERFFGNLKITLAKFVGLTQLLKDDNNKKVRENKITKKM